MSDNLYIILKKKEISDTTAFNTFYPYDLDRMLHNKKLRIRSDSLLSYVGKTFILEPKRLSKKFKKKIKKIFKNKMLKHSFDDFIDCTYYFPYNFKKNI